MQSKGEAFVGSISCPPSGLRYLATQINRAHAVLLRQR
jgi:hypothetical protein